jgi:hypothetical protein
MQPSFEQFAAALSTPDLLARIGLGVTLGVTLGDEVAAGPSPGRATATAGW